MMANKRVVVHIDMDAFYVQVERGINPNLIGKPIVVTQYNSGPGLNVKTLLPEDNRIDISDSNTIIAVSYEARARGVKRLAGMTVAEMRKKCPDLICVQVPTLHHKANTTIYREAGARVVNVLQSQNLIRSIIERASVDEVYMDITDACHALLARTKACADGSPPELSLEDMIQTAMRTSSLAGADAREIKLDKDAIRRGHEGTGVVVTGGGQVPGASWFMRPLYDWSAEDILLILGATIASQLRFAVFTQLGYTCSAGIAHNKLLAKVASAMHKPNQQTIVPASVVGPMLGDMPLDRVQGFGGKLGHLLQEEFNMITLGQLRALGNSANRAKLVARLGEKETMEILQRAEGVDDDPVQDRTAVKSIGSSKQFPGNRRLLASCFAVTAKGKESPARQWVLALCSDLLGRLQADYAANPRKPKLLVAGAVLQKVAHPNTTSTAILNSNADASSVVGSHERTRDHVNASRSTAFPVGLIQSADGPSELCDMALQLLRRILSEHKSPQEEVYINYLSVAATNFVDIQTGSNTIGRFFKANACSPTNSRCALPSKTADALTASPVKNDAVNCGDSDSEKGGSNEMLPLLDEPLALLDEDSSRLSSAQSMDERGEDVRAYADVFSSCPSRSESGSCPEGPDEALPGVDMSVFRELPLALQQELRQQITLQTSGFEQRNKRGATPAVVAVGKRLKSDAAHPWSDGGALGRGFQRQQHETARRVDVNVMGTTGSAPSAAVPSSIAQRLTDLQRARARESRENARARLFSQK